METARTMRRWVVGLGPLLPCLALASWFAGSAEASIQSTDGAVPQSILVLDSQPEDPVGHGIEVTFTTSDGDFFGATSSDTRAAILFRSTDLSHVWNLKFEAPRYVSLVS